jgi:small subunit ribosomal protein S6
MAQLTPTYDLVLLLDPQAQESAREKILADARQAIAAKGEIVRDDDWGDRALAYPIQRKADAEYHLLQFRTGAPELLSEMSRTLQITDGILRFRIVKLKPGTPEAPDMRAAAHGARPGEAHPHGGGTGRASASRTAAADAAPRGDAAATAQATPTGDAAPAGEAARANETAPTGDAAPTRETAPTDAATPAADTAPPDETTPATAEPAPDQPSAHSPAPDQPPAD